MRGPGWKRPAEAWRGAGWREMTANRDRAGTWGGKRKTKKQGERGGRPGRAQQSREGWEGRRFRNKQRERRVSWCNAK